MRALHIHAGPKGLIFGPLVRWHVTMLLRLSCLLFLLWTASVHAQLRIGDTAYYYDASNQLSLDEAKDRPFTPYSGIFSQGYKRGTYWLRVQLIPDENRNHIDSDMALTIQPPYLDDVTLVESVAAPGMHLPVGQQHGWRNNELSGLSLGFRLTAETGPRTLYLRVKTNTTYIVDMQLQSWEDARETRLRDDFLLHTLSVALMLLFFVSLVYWLMLRGTVMGVFALKQGMAWLYGASLLGYHRLFFSEVIDPVLLGASTKWIIVLYAWSSTHFHRQFFRAYNPRPLFMKVVAFFWWLSLFGAVLLVFGQVGWALLVTKATAIAGPIWMVILVHKGIDWQRIGAERRLLGKPTVMLVHWLMMIFLLLAAVPTLGFGLSGALTLYASLLHGVFTGLILLVMVHRQQILTSQHHMQQAMQAQTDLAVERTHRERQSQFMAMLTHELRTPLSVLRLAFPHANLSAPQRVKELALGAIDDMYGLIDHCNQLDRLDQKAQPVQIEAVSTALLVADLEGRFGTRTILKITDDSDTWVKCDRVLLLTVLNNLMDNAIKYGLAGHPVRIQVLTPSKETVQMSVTNRLPPTMKPDLQRMFDKFYRDPSAHRISGTGLGLYIVRALCELMQGRAWADMPDSQHIALWVELPRATAPMSRSPTPSNDRPPPPT